MKRYYKDIIKYSIVGQIFYKVKLSFFRIKWIRSNKHNQTVPHNIFNQGLVSVGNHSYGMLNIITFNDKSKLSIGSFVSIAENVTFLLDVEHHLDHLSTYPFKVKLLELEKYESFSKGDIVVEDDVWIGYGATILSGVKIGKGAVIAAGAVVSKDVPPYSVVGGVPAKVMRFRFNQKMINEIVNFDFDKLTNETVKQKLQFFYKPLDDIVVNSLCDHTK